MTAITLDGIASVPLPDGSQVAGIRVQGNRLYVLLNATEHPAVLRRALEAIKASVGSEWIVAVHTRHVEIGPPSLVELADRVAELERRMTA